jgi:hypothetical protein
MKKLWIIYFILDTEISEEPVFKQVYSSTCSTNEISISMTKIVHAVKGGLSYCDKVYSRSNINQKHRIGGVIVSVLASSAVDRGFGSRSGQTKDYKIGICCFSAKYAALRRKSKYWLARNQNDVSEWSDISTRGLLFQWLSIIKIQLSVLVWYKADLIIISLIINSFSP